MDVLCAPPGPVGVVDDVGRVGDQRSVVCVELAAQWAWHKWSNQRDAPESPFSTTIARVELARLVSGTADRMLECGPA